jgi:hypothetical protein
MGQDGQQTYGQIQNALVILNPNRDGYKKHTTVQLGVMYDSQATNRKQGGLPVRAILPAALLLVTWESYVYDSQLAKTYKNTTTNR